MALLGSPSTNEAGQYEARMGFMDHLRELRSRIRNAAIAYVLAVGVTYFFADWLFVWLTFPMLDAWQGAGMGPPTMHFKSPIEPLFVYVKIALLGGVFLASPVIFWQLWRFVAPGLYRNERRAILPFVLGSVVCFVGGAAFGYTFVFPKLFKFLFGFAKINLGSLQKILGNALHLQIDATPLRLEPTLMMEEYLGLASKTLIGFGICFELPVFLMFLGMIGIVDHRQLLRMGRYAIIVIFIISAIVTPDPTATTQIMLAVPLTALYYFGVLLVYVFGRRRQGAAATADQTSVE